MSFKNIKSAVVFGLEAFQIDIEVNIDNRGFPGFDIVGLAAKEINESKERVKAAIRNSGYKFPNKKIIINLAPADLPKKGSLYDVPIAVGILSACGILSADLNNFLFAGELSLDGDICKIPGSTLIAVEARKKQKILVIPESNLFEVGFVKSLKILAYKNLGDLISAFQSQVFQSKKPDDFKPNNLPESNDLIENIKGHEIAKRALMIAAAGRHNICLVGSPGSGKTLLARSLGTIIPDISENDFLDVMKINSVTEEDFSLRPKFRSPNHPISHKVLIGAGSPFSLGEITLAHKGILFLDEFTEFDNKLISALRQPLEDKKIQIHTREYQITLPCDFMLVISANPCPCGNYGDPDKKCICSDHQIQRYLGKLKNPLMDRVDLFVNVFSVSSSELLSDGKTTETSGSVRDFITQLREIQNLRCENFGLERKSNADFSPEEIKIICSLEKNAIETMNSLHKKYSSRSILKF